MGRVKAMLYDWRDDDDGTPETRTPTLAQREILHAEQDAAAAMDEELGDMEDMAFAVLQAKAEARYSPDDDDLAESLAVERAVDERFVTWGDADDFGGFSDL